MLFLINKKSSSIEYGKAQYQFAEKGLYLLLKNSCTLSLGTISSVNV
jgi:hypothetical protein